MALFSCSVGLGFFVYAGLNLSPLSILQSAHLLQVLYFLTHSISKRELLGKDGTVFKIGSFSLKEEMEGEMWQRSVCGKW